MGRASGSGGGGSRGPAVVRHTIIRPAGPAAAGAGGAVGSRPHAASGWAAQRQQLAAAPSAAALRQSLPAASSGAGRLSSPLSTPRSVPAKGLLAPSDASGIGNAAAAAERQLPPAGTPPQFCAAPAEAGQAVAKERRMPSSKQLALSGLDSLFIPKRSPSAPASRQPSPTLLQQLPLAQSPASALAAPGHCQQPCSVQQHSPQPRRRAESSGCVPAATPPRPPQPPLHQARPAPLQECDIFAEADAEVEQLRQQQRRRKQLGHAGSKRPSAAAASGGAPLTAHKRLRGAASPPSARPLRVLPLEEVDLFEGI